MENKQIKELMAAMERTGTRRLVMKKEGKDGFELQLEREEPSQFREMKLPLESVEEEISLSERMSERLNRALSRGKEMASSLSKSSSGQEPEKISSEEKPGTYVTSPMVGTFYSSPSPEDPSFVKLGEKIHTDTVLCIIEAMKVMNEVKAGVSGTVVEVLVENGHPVEFGTKLFKIIT